MTENDTNYTQILIKTIHIYIFFKLFKTHYPVRDTTGLVLMPYNITSRKRHPPEPADILKC